MQAGLQQKQQAGLCRAAATEEAEATVAPEALSQSLRIKLKSFDIGLLDLSVQEIMQVANSTGTGACLLRPELPQSQFLPGVWLI